MLEAMVKAPLGDEQRGDDPSVNALQERVARLLGQEAALLFPSATMATQVAVAVQCEAGDEVVCHDSAHVYRFEGGGLARNARAQCRPLGGERGRFSVEQLASALRPDDPHAPRTRLVVVENTSNLGGGSVWPLTQFEAIADYCQKMGLALHLDGARLLNAQVATATPAARWGERASSVQLCFSKGLGCPFGAVLASSRDVIA